MTQIYRPSPSGGLLQIKDGSSWLPILGISSISASGGDRETSDFETLDGGVESSFGGAGVKDIAIGLNPSFMGAQWRKIIENSFYGNDTVTIRYRTLANKTNVATGGTGEGVSIPALDAGVGNEVTLTFEKSSAGSTGKTAADAIEETSELGILVTGTDTAVGSGDRTEAEPAEGKFFIVRHDGTNLKASEWKGRALSSAITTKDGWALIRYGIAVEYTCRVTSGVNPDFSAGSQISDTLNLRQVTSGYNIYPITKAAS